MIEELMTKLKEGSLKFDDGTVATSDSPRFKYLITDEPTIKCLIEDKQMKDEFFHEITNIETWTEYLN